MRILNLGPRNTNDEPVAKYEKVSHRASKVDSRLPALSPRHSHNSDLHVDKERVDWVKVEALKKR